MLLLLFIGDDWAEDHHDVEVQEAEGETLKTSRLAQGLDGMTRFHALIAACLAHDAEPGQLAVCNETERGPWVRALVAAGCRGVESIPSALPCTERWCRSREPRAKG